MNANRRTPAEHRIVAPEVIPTSHAPSAHADEQRALEAAALREQSRDHLTATASR
ncbi:MAG TPA: hypothetical protein VK279_06160 [Solirubrobacteraceae bacterium]|nr:hypothetical protein [Solirubrobacteraceae bacterium]